MNKRRLLKLADLLEADAKNKKGIKFDLGTWGIAKSSKYWALDAPEPAVSCGTTACAMGLAAISGAFNREGLRFKTYPTGIGKSVTVQLGRSQGLNAAKKLFAIKLDTARWLFLESSYDSATTGAAGERFVAKRIRRFVAGKENPPQ